MKRVLALSIILLVSMALVYPLFAFYWWTFDASQWSADARISAILLYSTISAISALLTQELK